MNATIVLILLLGLSGGSSYLGARWARRSWAARERTLLADVEQLRADLLQLNDRYQTIVQDVAHQSMRVIREAGGQR